MKTNLLIIIFIQLILSSCQKKEQEDQSATPNAIVNSTIGHVVTPVGIVYKTTNSGLNWSFVGDSFSGTYDGVGIDFVTSTTGYVVTPVGTVYKTINSGLSWSFVGDSFSGTYSGVDLDFF